LTPIIETVDLVKEYPQAGEPLRVLDMVNLAVEQGEFPSWAPPAAASRRSST